MQARQNGWICMIAFDLWKSATLSRMIEIASQKVHMNWTWIGYGCWFLGFISSPLQWLRTSLSSEWVPADENTILSLKPPELWGTQWLGRLRPVLLAFQIPTDFIRVLSGVGMYFWRDWRLSKIRKITAISWIFLHHHWHPWDIQRSIYGYLSAKKTWDLRKKTCESMI